MIGPASVLSSASQACSLIKVGFRSTKSAWRECSSSRCCFASRIEVRGVSISEAEVNISPVCTELLDCGHAAGLTERFGVDTFGV